MPFKDIVNLQIPNPSIIFATDFREIYTYLFPFPEIFKNFKFDESFQKSVLFSECLFSDFFDLRILLLPHYEAELWNVVYRVINIRELRRKRFSDEILRLFNEKARNIFSSIKINNYKMRDFDQLDDENKEILYNFISNNFDSIINLTTISNRNPLTSILNLFERKRLIPFRNFKKLPNLDPQEIEYISENIWAPILKEIRPFKEMSNFVDSHSLAYVYELNRKFQEEGLKKIVILLTSSHIVHDVFKKVLIEKKIGIEKINDRFDMELIQHPSMFLTYLQFCNSRNNHLINHSAMQEPLELLNDFMRYRFDYDDIIKDINKHENSLDKYKNFFEWANNKLPKVNDLISRWKNLELVTKQNNELFNDIKTKFLLRPHSLLNEYKKEQFDNLSELLKILDSDTVRKYELPSRIEKIIEQIEHDSNKIFYRRFMMLQKFANTRSPRTSYMIEYDDPEVASIYNDIITKDDSPKKLSLEKLQEAEEHLYEILFNRPTFSPEAALLYAYFLAKEPDKLNEALKNLQKINYNNYGDSFKRKYKFIENIVKSASDPNYLMTAIQECEKLINQDPEESRYYIQKGFFIWRSFRVGLSASDYYREDDVLENWKKALEKENQKRKSGKILRVILSDLALFYFEKNDFKMFNEYFKKLKKLHDNREGIKQGAAWNFMKGLNNWMFARNKPTYVEKIKKYRKAEEQIQNALTLFDSSYYNEKKLQLEEEIRKFNINS